jgi:hypothetical protein
MAEEEYYDILLFQSAICGGTCSGRAVIVSWLAGFFCMLSERTGEVETSHKFRELPPLNKQSNTEAAKSRSRQASQEACLIPPSSQKSAK